MADFPCFNQVPLSISVTCNKAIHHFGITDNNIDFSSVEAFGDEWTKFNYFTDSEINKSAMDHYFDIVNIGQIKNKRVLDVGCGTGRWTKYISQYAQSVDAIDPSRAIESAAMLLSGNQNVRLSQAAVDSLPFFDDAFDFIFSLGVLHHIPDTQLAMTQCIKKLKSGGYILFYLYYNLDNRGMLYRSIFNISTFLRTGISKMPSSLKNFCCDILALSFYLPFISLSWVLKNAGLKNYAKKVPLHFYVGKTLNVIRNDARDRFGTPLEQRFTKQEITQMMERAGLIDIVFSDNEPYWHVVGKKK